MPFYRLTRHGPRLCIENGHTTNSIPVPKADGLTVHGIEDEAFLVEDHVFDFRNIPENVQDEVLSGVNAARVTMRRCIILGGIKAILAGNGDHPLEDYGQASWELEDCAILYSGRRCPEAQDGTRVTMRRCWVHGWGHSFDVRSFGAWAHRGGVILAEDCLFTQDSFFACGLAESATDLANHIGQAVNQYKLPALLHWRTWLPGACRGLTADTGGLVLGNRCWTNKWWVRLENAENMLDTPAAKALAGKILDELGKTPAVRQQALALRAIAEYVF